MSSPQSPEICININLDILFSADKLLLKIGLEKLFKAFANDVHLDPEKNQPRRGEVGDQIHSVVPVVKVKDSSRQGCISCGILVSRIRARGVSLEHMEMFSCSPT